LYLRSEIHFFNGIWQLTKMIVVLNRDNSKPMKKIFSLFLVTAVAAAVSYAQPNSNTTTTGDNKTENKEDDDDDSCYRKWHRIFKLRGADEVPDGEYDNVIVTFREGTSGNCYYGKAIVKKGFLKEIYVRFSDGKYEKVEFDPKEEFGIANGISDPVVAHLKNQRQVLNVIFKEKLRPKGNAYDQAPDPELDDYN